jgi:amidohydrolase
MDALPMDDECGRPYSSRNRGIAHLCGHDGHVAALLGAAHVLSGLRDHIPGAVKFFFEPAEEMTPPGELSGAEAMLRDGAFDNPRPSAVFGGHFYPDWPAGSIALRAGTAFSGNDSVRLTVIGRESHTAVPHSGVDALLVAAHVITGLQTLASHFDIGEAVSMHFSTISGGRMPNLIAERVELAGTFRISDEKLRDEMPVRFERMVNGVCEAFGARYELDYRLRNLPPVVSTKREADIMRAALHEVLGPDNTIEMRHPRLAGDTMQHWLARAPGVFFMVGTANSDPATQWPSHHQKFDVAPETWPAAVSAIAMTAIRYLEQSARRGTDS